MDAMVQVKVEWRVRSGKIIGNDLSSSVGAKCRVRKVLGGKRRGYVA